MVDVDLCSGRDTQLTTIREYQGRPSFHMFTATFLYGTCSWEPIESFDGSEHIVATFWQRTNTNGRDIHDLSLFQAGETFLPLGPPREQSQVEIYQKLSFTEFFILGHKLKRKSSHKTLTIPPPEDVQLIKSKSPTPEPSSKHSEKRRHTEFEPSRGDSDRPSKRARESNTHSIQSSSPLVPERSPDTRARKRPLQTISFSNPSSSKKNLRRIDLEVVPDSDEEMNGPATLTMNLINPNVIEEANQPSGSTILSTSLHTSEHEAVDFHPLFDEEPIERVPTLRDRLVEPRVKMIDDPKLSNIEGAIPAKANAAARMSADPSSSKPTVLRSDSKQSGRHSKPGPGRSSAGLKVKNVSSLLTFSNGSLKTVKGKYVKERPRAHTDLTIRDDPPDVLEVDDAIGENLLPAPPPTAEELLRLAGFNTEIADTLPDYEDNPLQMNVIQPILSEAAEQVAAGPVAAEQVAPEFVAPTTAAENENDEESSSLPRERSANCLSFDTNLTKIA